MWLEHNGRNLPSVCYVTSTRRRVLFRSWPKLTNNFCHAVLEHLFQQTSFAEVLLISGAMPMAKAEARRQAILEMVRNSKLVSVSEISQRFGVSEVSIRRDLVKLGEYGLLQRVHGGAVSVTPDSLDHYYNKKSELRSEEKKRIGRVAASLVRPGESIMLDSGTTVLQVARHILQGLAETHKLTVITQSFPVFRELASARNIDLTILGGLYLPDYQTLVGPQTVANLRDLHVDKLFMGADGMSLHHGVTTATVLEAEVDRAAVRAAAEVIIVADSSKINGVGFTTIIPLTEIDKLITDTEAPDDFIETLRQQGVEVILA